MEPAWGGGLRNEEGKRDFRDTAEVEMTGFGRQDVGVREEKSRIALRF